MRRIARFALEGFHPSVEFCKTDRIPLGDQASHILRFRLRLEGIISVEVKTAGRGARQICTAFYISSGTMI